MTTGEWIAIAQWVATVIAAAFLWSAKRGGTEAALVARVEALEQSIHEEAGLSKEWRERMGGKQSDLVSTVQAWPEHVRAIIREYDFVSRREFDLVVRRDVDQRTRSGDQGHS